MTSSSEGAKLISREKHLKIAQNRSYFGDFDFFGDYDPLFGASKLNLKITEVPIHYATQNHGITQISRFRDGWLLVRMIGFAWRKLKAI